MDGIQGESLLLRFSLVECLGAQKKGLQVIARIGSLEYLFRNVTKFL